MHPPLFILVLRIWASLGHSELILRLLCVLAGIGFSWIVYRWVERVFDRETALVSLSVLLFVPSLVLLSAELVSTHCSCSLPLQVSIFWITELRLTHGIGVFGILLFIFAVTWLVTQRQPHLPGKPTGRQLAFLFALPFAIMLAAAIVGLYPYGGIRHDALLAMFAIPGISFGFTRLPLRSWRLKSAILASALVVCNVFSSPTPPYIRFRDQNRTRMSDALRFVTQVTRPGAIVFADHPAGLLLSYYLCRRRVVPLQPLAEPFLKSDCDTYEIITPGERHWSFDARLLDMQLEGIGQTYKLPADTSVLLFQAGWIYNKDPNWLAALRRGGCGLPKSFGNNILVCDFRVVFASAGPLHAPRLVHGVR